jgi:DNA-directed RNA polymerase specialized sigma24 family protein
MHPDYDIVARMAAGETQALDELRARHGRTAYAMAFGVLLDAAGAEHAVSEAFLEAFRQASRFTPGDLTVVAWLTALTRRRAEAMAAVYS